MPPIINGEKDEIAEGKKGVKFISAKFPSRKSAAANTINTYPMMGNIFFISNVN